MDNNNSLHGDWQRGRDVSLIHLLTLDNSNCITIACMCDVIFLVGWPGAAPQDEFS